MKLRASLKRWLIHKVRGYFEEWKLEAERKEVVRYNSQEGPIAVESHHLKTHLYNLKLLALEEGIPSHKLNKILSKNNT